MPTRRTATLLFLIALIFCLLPSTSAFGAGYTVNTTDDNNDGSCNSTHCSLREAILAANASAGPDLISFNISGCVGVCTITPNSNLPFLTDGGTIINGYSQPGSAVAAGASPAIILIELDGSNVTNNNGLNVTSGANEICGLMINHFGLYGVAIYGSSATGNLLWGSVIGTNAIDMTGIGNGGGVGLGNAAHDNQIGGDSPPMRNIISGNKLNGIDIIALPGAPAYDNVVIGNYIGTNQAGTAALGNVVTGLQLGYGAYGNQVGGTTTGERNIISGNGSDGIVLHRDLTTGNTVLGNCIGTDRSCSSAVPNGANGVSIYGGADNNLIGGSTSSSRNIISGNGANGVRLYGPSTIENSVSGNYLGLALDGSTPLPNQLSGVLITEGASNNTIGGDTSGEGNVISGNDLHGIYLTDGTAEPEYPEANVISGNLIGTDTWGTASAANGDFGVRIDGGAQNNTIGGASPAMRNVISGNTLSGVALNGSATTGNTLVGNYIGLAMDGFTSLPNQNDGITIWGGAYGNNIGGTTAGARNVISGNYGYGITIDDSGTNNNVISGNYIGLDASGTTARGSSYGGIRITDGAQGTIIGGETSGAGNVISANGGDGICISDSGSDVSLIAGNLIGTDHTGLLARGNDRWGIELESGPSGTTIGGTPPSTRNVIAANLDGGIHLYQAGIDGTDISNNYIGVGSDGLTSLPNGMRGIWLESGPTNTVIGGGIEATRNVIAGHTSSNIALTGTGTLNNFILGNYIGLGADGLTDLTGSGAGIYLSSGASDTMVGGNDPGDGNVISGNRVGIQIAGAASVSNMVWGNFIGTDASGLIDVGNEYNGVEVYDNASNNGIGGDGYGEGNVISGNGHYGVYISGAANNTIQGNKIGTDSSGMCALPNNYDGVFITNGAQDTTIGGPTAGSGNLISSNTLSGINILLAGTDGTTIQGNLIGTDAAGLGDLGNGEYGISVGGGVLDATIGPGNRVGYNNFGGILVFGADTEGIVITQNSIFHNEFDGIIVTSGGNNNIAPPTILSTVQGSVDISGTACSGCNVEVFANPQAEQQGRFYVGSTTADPGGNWSLTVACVSGGYLTATATDSVDGTSEFSNLFTSTVKCLFLPLIQR